jgi:hypothetical protein
MPASRDMCVTKKFQKWLKKWPKFDDFEPAKIRNLFMSHIPLASAEVKFRRIGHGSQAMPNNSKWYSNLEISKKLLPLWEDRSRC